MKHIALSILMLAGILLTACSPATTGTSIGTTNNNLPIETQLAVGTLKLSGSAQDITAEQAKDLVLYWQVYKGLSQSDTAAQAEVDGLVAQIQETMTSDQMQAITDMKITQQDVVASIQGAGVVSGSSGTNAVSVPSGSSSGNGMPAGGPPDGGGVPPDAGAIPVDMGGAASASGTSQTQSAQAGTRSTVITGVPSALLEAVIQALQQKIAA
jgi:hypothetical protein